MSSFTQYLWGIYMVAAFGLILMLWYSLRNVRPVVLQDVPVVLAIAVLLTPCSALPGGSVLAPALVALAIEGLFDTQLNVWRGGMPILLAAVTLLILLFAKYWIVARFFSNTSRRAALATANSKSATPVERATTESGVDLSRPDPEAQPGSEPDHPIAESPGPVKGPAVDSN